MKYNKIVKDGYKNRDSYLISIVFSVLLFLSLCYFSNDLKGTHGWFDGVKPPVLTYDYVVTYSSNYPVDSLENSVFVVGAFDKYLILDNTFFTVPEGYKFIGWNSKPEGIGTIYQSGIEVELSTNIYFYAMWDLVSNNEEDNSSDTDSGNVENGTDNNNNDNVDNDNSPSLDKPSVDVGNNPGGSSGNGGGSAGTGSSNSSNVGSGNTGNIGGGSSSGGTSNNNSNNDNNFVEDSNDGFNSGNNNEEIVLKTYKFKYVNGENNYAMTSCNVLYGDNCELVFPQNNPIKIGYKFIGWSLSNLCIEEEIINEEIDVDGDRTYYACYNLDEEYNNEDNSWIYLVVIIWIIAGILIYFVIRRFNKNVEND